MRLDMLIKKVGTTKNTTVFEPVCKPGAMKQFNVNTEAVSSLPVDLDTEELGLAISSYPIVDGTMAMIIPPVPFYKVHISLVQYQHTDEMKEQGRRKSAPARTSTPDQPVTLAYVRRASIDDNLVAEREPLHFGLYLVTAVTGDRTQSLIEDGGEEIDGGAGRMDVEGDYGDSVLEEWLKQQLLAGRSQEDIARELGKHIFKPDGSPDSIHQSTIGRSIGRISHGEGITGKVKRAIRALFTYEAELDARVEADQVAFLELMDALDEWRAFNAYEAKRALNAHRRSVAAQKDLKARQDKVREHASTVIRRMQELGIVEKGDTRFYADGAALISKGAVNFTFLDKEVEIISYSPGGAILPDGRTAGEFCDGVPLEKRMQRFAVLPGQHRPEMIGNRRANLIPKVSYYGGKWFWGHLYADIAAWYELRDAAPGWWEDGRELPKSPDEDDISWYELVLELETRLLEAGLVFEESLLGWSDDWTGEVEQKRAVLRDMERRRAGAEAAAARKAIGLKVAQWVVIAIVALGINWYVVIPVLEWAEVRFWAVAKAVRETAVTSYDGLESVGEDAATAAETVFTSPLTAIAMLVMVGLVITFYPSPVRGQTDPARPWVMGITTLIGLSCIIALAIWAVAQVDWPRVLR